MLFDNFVTIDIPKSWKAQLKEDFPAFPESPVKLTWADSMYSAYTYVDERKPTKPLGKTKKAPNAVGHKLQRAVMVEGASAYIQWSETLPSVDRNGQKTFKGSNKVNIGEDFTIKGTQEDLLAYLYFVAPFVANNKAPEKSGMPEYKFVFADREAKAEIDNFSKVNETKMLIYNTLTDAQVSKCITGLQLTAKGSAEENRTYLYKQVHSGTEIFKKNFYELAKSKPAKAEEETNEVEESISDFVSTLRSEDKIKFTEGVVFKKNAITGEWNKTPVWDSKQKDNDTAFFLLVEHLEINTVKLEELKKLKG